MTRQRPSGAVTSRRERLFLGAPFPDQNVRSGPHAPTDEHRLARSAQCVGQARVSGAEGPGRALAMNKQLALFALDRMCLDLAGIMRDIKK